MDFIDKEDVVSVRQSSFGAELLVKDRKFCEKKYPNGVIETTTLEEIMLFYAAK